MKKILFFMRDLRLAGGERCVVSVINSLDRTRFTPVLAAFNFSGQLTLTLRDDVIVHTPGVKQGGAFSFIFDFCRYYLFLVKVIKREQPDILFCSNWLASLIGCYCKWRSQFSLKLVVVSHTPIKNLLSVSSLGNLFVPIKYSLTRMLFNQADAIVAITQGMKRDLTDYLKLTHPLLPVIYNGIDEQAIQDQAKASSGAIPFKTPYIVSVGRLSEEKGHEILIRAYCSVADQIEHQLVIVGDGDRKQHLNKLVSELSLDDRVILVGEIQSPFGIMKNADFLVLPSKWELFPLVLLEAFALGVPVVATACGGPVEALDNGRYGLLVPVNDVNALAAAMLSLASDLSLRRSFCDKIMARGKEFDFHRMIEQYEELFSDM